MKRMIIILCVVTIIGTLLTGCSLTSIGDSMLNSAREYVGVTEESETP